jgi:hypothetical protein
MKSISRRLGLLLVVGAAGTGLSIGAPSVALADPTAVAATSAAGPPGAVPNCEPAKVGPEWRWHDNGHSGHWDSWERRDDGWEWKHHWREDRYCADEGTEKRDDKS